MEAKKSCLSDLNWSPFTANNVVALDHCRNANRFMLIVLLLIDAHHAPVSTHEYFRATRNSRRQGQQKINFRSGGNILLHHETNAADRKGARLTSRRRRISYAGFCV